MFSHRFREKKTMFFFLVYVPLLFSSYSYVCTGLSCLFVRPITNGPWKNGIAANEITVYCKNLSIAFMRHGLVMAWSLCLCGHRSERGIVNGRDRFFFFDIRNRQQLHCAVIISMFQSNMELFVIDHADVDGAHLRTTNKNNINNERSEWEEYLCVNPIFETIPSWYMLNRVYHSIPANAFVLLWTLSCAHFPCFTKRCEWFSFVTLWKEENEKTRERKREKEREGTDPTPFS